jgi:hypothetical protein
MAGDRSERALARIEAAMRRIELAAQSSPESVNVDAEQRYRQLWTATSGALAEIDQLIGSLER